MCVMLQPITAAAAVFLQALSSGRSCRIRCEHSAAAAAAAAMMMMDCLQQQQLLQNRRKQLTLPQLQQQLEEAMVLRLAVARTACDHLQCKMCILGKMISRAGSSWQYQIQQQQQQQQQAPAAVAGPSVPLL
jgi:hypothetical protein